MHIRVPTEHPDLYTLARAVADDLVANTLWLDVTGELELARRDAVGFALLLVDGCVAVWGRGTVICVDAGGIRGKARALIGVERWGGPGAVVFREMSDPMRPTADSAPPPDFSDEITALTSEPAF